MIYTLLFTVAYSLLHKLYLYHAPIHSQIVVPICITRLDPDNRVVIHFQPNESFTEAACVLYIVLIFTLFFNTTHTDQFASQSLIRILAPVAMV